VCKHLGMTANRPTVRAHPENGTPVDDPSEEVIQLLLENIEAGTGTFLILERTSDAAGQTYAQALRQDDGSYLVEHREGDAQHHYGTVVADLRAAQTLLAGWAFERPGWDAGLAWSPVDV
jgi:hypothetical protein